MLRVATTTGRLGNTTAIAEARHRSAFNRPGLPICSRQGRSICANGQSHSPIAPKRVMPERHHCAGVSLDMHLIWIATMTAWHASPTEGRDSSGLKTDAYSSITCGSQVSVVTGSKLKRKGR
jgi:hypothetical protein